MTKEVCPKSNGWHTLGHFRASYTHAETLMDRNHLGKSC